MNLFREPKDSSFSVSLYEFQKRKEITPQVLRSFHTAGVRSLGTRAIPSYEGCFESITITMQQDFN